MLLLASAPAEAGPATTRSALDRLEEVLELRIAEGLLSREDVMPAVVVRAAARTDDSADGFTAQVLDILEGAFGTGGLRLCEACAAPRAYVEDGALTYQSGPVGLDEVARLDDLTRGVAPPARAAIWVDEIETGVSVRVVDLRTGRVLFAQNVDPNLSETKRTRRMYTLAAELERRARGDSLTQGFVDFGLYPGQHVSMDWTDQWGKRNGNLTGVTLSILDPVIGLGICHYQHVDLANLLVGAKVIVSLPTVVARSQGDSGDILDPPLTAVGVLRVPFGRANYGATLTVSTNGVVGLGLSLLNIRFLPVLP